MKKTYGQIKANRIYNRMVKAVNEGTAAYKVELDRETMIDLEIFYTSNHKIAFRCDWHDEEIIEAYVIY